MKTRETESQTPGIQNHSLSFYFSARRKTPPILATILQELFDVGDFSSADTRVTAPSMNPSGCR